MPHAHVSNKRDDAYYLDHQKYMDRSLGKGVLTTFLSKMSFVVEIVCMGLEIKMSKFE